MCYICASEVVMANLNCSFSSLGAREAAFRNIKSIAECLADELINAAKVSVSVTRLLLSCLYIYIYEKLTIPISAPSFIGTSQSEPHINHSYEKIAVLVYVCVYIRA